jgi:hypothetical protein
VGLFLTVFFGVPKSTRSSILVALWGIAGILLLFLYAYRRALQLINPIEQLNIMSTVVRRDLRKWSRLADNAAILLRETPAPMLHEANAGFQFLGLIDRDTDVIGSFT